MEYKLQYSEVRDIDEYMCLYSKTHSIEVRTHLCIKLRNWFALKTPTENPKILGRLTLVLVEAY